MTKVIKKYSCIEEVFRTQKKVTLRIVLRVYNYGSTGH